MIYRLFVPGQTVGASTVHWDLFNAAGSASEVTLLSVLPVPDGSVAVTGLVAVDVFLTRTTAVGTGGTVAVAESTALTTTPAITAHDCSQRHSGSITARLTPSGGATAGAMLSFRSLFTEESSAATYMPTADMVTNGVANVPGIVVPEGTGVRVVQGSVASVGVVGYDVIYSVRQK